MNKDRRSHWEAIATENLVGRTIKEVFYMTDAEIAHMGWDSSGVVLMLDNDVAVIVQRDDEGNGPGALYLSNPTQSVIVPTL